MPKASPALERLVANENSLSDLLAYLFEWDPQPLIGLLGLAPGTYRCRREVKAQQSGRMDLVVYRQPGGDPVAVLELKGASDEHDGQLDRYRAWAETFDPVPALFYCTFDSEPRPPWQSLSLRELFGAWQAVADPYPARLAQEIVAVLRQWDAEADGVIGEAQGWYVPDMVSRRTARALDDVLRREHPDDGQASAMGTTVGNPMLMAWRRHPRGSDQAWIGVDVRCPGRGVSASPWLFRPCVDVYQRDQSQEGAQEAVLEAHDLAVALQPAMMLSAVRQALVAHGRPELAEALYVTKHDGLAGPADPTILSRWRATLVAGGGTPKRHPVFRHDKGRTLATQFRLDVARLTRTDLADLTLAVLDHLVDHAGRTPEAAAPEKR